MFTTTDKPLVSWFCFDKSEDVGICLYSIGGDIEADVTGWKMAAANQW